MASYWLALRRLNEHHKRINGKIERWYENTVKQSELNYTDGEKKWKLSRMVSEWTEKI